MLSGYIQKAMALNESGTKVARPLKRPRTELVVPTYFTAALSKNQKARATFEAFSPSHRREYVEWIAEGKPSNWKYMRS